MGFTRAQLDTYRDKPVPDLIGENVSLLFVGINPGLWTAATQTHFSHPSNRFYPALADAGLIDFTVDTDTGMTATQSASLIESGIGITNLVNRATARASELSTAELREGGEALEQRVLRTAPVVVAVAGITAYRTAFRRPGATSGLQPEGIGEAQLWVVPNPSGLNAHETVDSLARWYGQVARAAGLK